MESNAVIRNKTLELVQIALMIAVTCAATMSIRIPTFIGYAHLGDSMVLLSAVLLGKKKGVIAGAIGMFLADVIGGYMVWAPITLFIKGVMAFIAASIAYRKNYYGENVMNNIFAFTVAGAWMIFAYYIANVFLIRFVYTEASTAQESMILALASLQGNFLQAIFGIAIAVPLVKTLKKVKALRNIF